MRKAMRELDPAGKHSRKNRNEPPMEVPRGLTQAFQEQGGSRPSAGVAKSRRQQRVAEAVVRRLSDWFSSGDLHDLERLLADFCVEDSSVSVVKADISRDMKHLTIYWDAPPMCPKKQEFRRISEDDFLQVLENFLQQRYEGQIRTFCAQLLKMRFAPYVILKRSNLDSTVDQFFGMDLEQTFEDVDFEGLFRHTEDANLTSLLDFHEMAKELKEDDYQQQVLQKMRERVVEGENLAKQADEQWAEFCEDRLGISRDDLGTQSFVIEALDEIKAERGDQEEDEDEEADVELMRKLVRVYHERESS